MTERVPMTKGDSPWQFEWFRPPAGGRLRYGHVKAEQGCRGTLVLFMGRCEYLQKYNELASDWRARGFQVFALEWRGQGLSDRFLPNRQKCHVPDYDVHSRDLEAWLDAVVKPDEAGPTLMFAHSMGGLIGLRALVALPGRFAAAVVSAPMVAIDTGWIPAGGARLLARSAWGLGYEDRYAVGQGDYNPAVDAVFENNTLTSDPERFRRIHQGYLDNPDLRLGGVTFGWLIASFRAQEALVLAQVLGGVKTPVLLVSPDADKLVPPAVVHKVGGMLPDCTLVEVPGSRHDPLHERDELRQPIWGKIDRFLERFVKAN